MALKILFLVAILSVCLGEPLRYMAINVGNCGTACWESKLCETKVVVNINSFIAKYVPDIILLSEVYTPCQLFGSCSANDGRDGDNISGQRILPPQYNASCHLNFNRNGSIGPSPVYGDASSWSHSHECVAWIYNKFSLVPDTQLMTASAKCNFDFTGYRIDLLHFSTKKIVRAISVHPPSGPFNAGCRAEVITNIWSKLWNNYSGPTIVGGDWNTEEGVSPPSQFKTDYSLGVYADGYKDLSQYTCFCPVFYPTKYDHLFNYGLGNTITSSFPHGAAIGGYDVPRADGGYGCDHRQIIADRQLD